MVFLVFHRYFRRFPVSFRQKHGFGPSFGLVRAEIFPASVAGKAKNVPVGFFLHKPCLPEACPNPVLSGLVVALAEIQGRLLALRLSFASDGCFFNRQPRLVVLDVCVESCDIFRSGGYFHTGVACKHTFVQIVGEIQFLRVVDEIGG